MKILALDTASGQCSAALLLDGALQARSVVTARDHARLLLPMIDALLVDAGITLRQLDGIAFGRGPGSFTGVRVAASATQGLALGADLPVRPVSDLRALAEQARRRAASGFGTGSVLACMDARMGEVYWAAFQLQGELLGDHAVVERVGSPAALLGGITQRPLLAAGLGLSAYPEIVGRLELRPDQYFGDAEPHARDVAQLAALDLGAGAQWLQPEAAQPVYVRDEVAKIQG